MANKKRNKPSRRSTSEEILRDAKDTNIHAPDNAPLKKEIIADIESVLDEDIQNQINNLSSRFVLLIGDDVMTKLAACYAYCYRSIDLTDKIKGFRQSEEKKRVDYQAKIKKARSLAVPSFQNPSRNVNERTSPGAENIDIAVAKYTSSLTRFRHVDCFDEDLITLEHDTGDWLKWFCSGNTVFLRRLRSGDTNKCKQFTKDIRKAKIGKQVDTHGMLIISTDNKSNLPGYFIDEFETIEIGSEKGQADVLVEGKDKENVPPNLNKNIFCYKGGKWEITFNGKMIYPTDREGYHYISYVLSKPRENLHNYRIYQDVKGLAFGSVTEGQKFDAKLYPESSTKIKTTKKDKADDYQKNKEMIEDLDKNDNELEKEKSELENEGSVNASRLAEIDEQLNHNIEIRKSIAQGFNSSGGDKSKNEKIIYNVYMNTYRCLQVIENEDPFLRAHLKAFFTNGKEYTFYNPDRDISWQTNCS